MRAEAKHLSDEADKGRKLVDQAWNDAVLSMRKLVETTKTPEGKTEALRHHALHIGVASEFMQEVAPRITEVLDDALELAEGDDDKTAGKMLTNILLAKVFINIQNELNKLTNE